jgi:hypothetical protein
MDRRVYPGGKGQTMILVVFLLALLTILTTGLHELWQMNMPTYKAARYGLQAFYLAQAGIERAKLAALGTVTTFTEPLCGDTTTQSCGYCYYIMQDNGTGFLPCSQTHALPMKYLYNFTVTNIGGNQRTVTGRGRVLDLANTTIAQRQISLTIDIAAPGVVADSWQER